MFKQHRPWKILILATWLLLSVLLLMNRSPIQIVVLTLLIQALFIISLRFYSIPFLILYFTVSSLVLLAQPPLNSEMLVFKFIGFAMYVFIAFLGYYALKSIEDEFYVNKNFVLEEKQNLGFIETELSRLQERKLTLEDQTTQLHMLSNMLNKAWTLTSWDEIVKFSTQQVHKLFPQSTVIFSELSKENNGAPRITCAVGTKELRADTKIDDLDNYIFSQPIPILVENVDTELTFKISPAPDAPFTYKSFMAAPIQIDGNRSAAIKVYGRHAKDFTNIHLRLLQYVSEMLSMLLLNISLYEKTEKLARTDGITGLYVQHYFMEKIQEEIYRAKKHGDIFSLIIIDIDNFKLFNDNYGHQAGDFILSKTSDFIKSFIRSIDFPCRYGGDEFFIILPGTDAQGARTLAERIRSKICEETNHLEFAGVRIERNITVSIGCGQYHPLLGDHKSFISKIDGFLYAAKRQGKNRVVGDSDAQ